MKAYDAVTRHEIEIERPLHGNIVVRRYLKPEETLGGIIIADQYRADSTQTLWEVEQGSSEADDIIGARLDRGDIVVTLRRWPVDSGYVNEEGDRLFFMRVEEVRNVIKCEW